MKSSLIFSLITIAGLSVFTACQIPSAPKRLLVVSTTMGFRHSCIPTTEKVLTELGAKSGEFKLDFIEQPAGKPTNLTMRAPASVRAEYRVAESNWEAGPLTAALQKLSPESLKNYDGVVFVDTTGDLPLPDRQGFLDWIKAGHAFIGIHSASDTLHGWHAYADMLGGEFDHHGPQTNVLCLNEDPNNPATAPLDPVWAIQQEEIYQFKKSYDPTKVHELLVLDKSPQTGKPGHFPLAWCKSYGQGRVFYTALGHREDIIDTAVTGSNRVNSLDTTKAYQAHLLGGVEWALGLK